MSLRNHTGPALTGIDFRRMGLIAEVLGAPELLAKLRQAELKIQRKIARSAVNAGLSELTAEMRRQIDNAPISAALKAAMKKTVGKRIKTKQIELFGILEAKAGLGVGKRTKARKQEQKIQQAVRTRKGKGAKRGVGIGAWNVHWPGIGTKPRRTRRGKALGRMAGQNIASLAMHAAGSRVINVIAKRASDLIERELNLSD
ncbi:MAG: hypothetical protein E6Q76_12785 [Rhizobium sp.]|nr:MAG: hypothetical protein E6Q76_12785 [Rhizobium sp.]